MKKIIVNTFLCMLICFTGRVYGQYEETQYIPPTPNEAKLAQFSITPTNLYTGAHNLGVPLYTIDFDGVKIPLSISYHSGGIRAGEDASFVGLGWALSSAGSISRTVVGYNDIYTTSGLLGYVYDGTSIPSQPIFEIDYSSGAGYKINEPAYYDYLDLAPRDTEPDIFSYNFLGSSGSFVLSKKSETPGNVIKVIKLTENPDLISFNEIDKTFTVVTPSGFKGVFDIKQYSLGLGGSSGSGWTGCQPQNIDVLQAINDGKRAITSWHLSTIVSPKGRTLNFDYKLNANDYSDYVSISQESFGERQSFNSNLILGQGLNGDTQSCSRTIFEHVYLDRIYSDDSGVEINFNYTNRNDMEILTETSWINALLQERGESSLSIKPAQKLSSIDISNSKNGSTLDNRVFLFQSYFNEGSADPVQDERLRLDEIKVNDQVYKFEYNDGLPGKSTLDVDYWGFYNGANNSQLFLGLSWLQPLLPSINDSFFQNPFFYYQNNNGRKANFQYGKAGLLTKVVYPTGGSTVYAYEPHDYELLGDEYNIPNGSKVIVADGNHGTDIQTFSYDGDPIPPYNGTCNGLISIILRVQCKDFFNGGQCTVDDDDMSDVAVEFIDNATGGVRSFLTYQNLWAAETNQFTLDRSGLGAGSFTIKAYRKTDGNGNTKYYGSATIIYPNSCDASQVSSIRSIHVSHPAGGARIAQITNKDSDGSPVEKRKFSYVNNTNGFSSGKLMNPLLYVYRYCTPVISANGGYEGGNCFYISRSGSNIAGSNNAKGNHIGYSLVKETFEHKDGGSNNGYRLHYFSNNANQLSSWGLNPIVTNNILNGTKTYESTFTSDNTQVNSVDYNDLSDDTGSDIIALGVHRAPKIGGGNGPGIFHQYYLDRKFVSPKEIVTTDFLDDGNVVNTNNMTYNSRYQKASQAMTNSDGETISNEIKYPYELSSSTVYDEMIAQNILAPIEQVKKIDGVVVEAIGFKYKLVSGNVVLDKVFQYNPEKAAFVSTTDGINFTGGYEEVANYLFYDDKGQPTEYITRSGIHTTLIWGYDHTYPVAMIQNATKAQIDGLSGVTTDVGVAGLSLSQISTLQDNLPSTARVTIYEYDPGVGIKKVHDSNGLTTSYEFDQYGRLEYVKDTDNNILQKIKYNYSNSGN